MIVFFLILLLVAVLFPSVLRMGCAAVLLVMILVCVGAYYAPPATHTHNAEQGEK